MQKKLKSKAKRSEEAKPSVVTKRSASTDIKLKVQACKKKRVEVNGVEVVETNYSKKEFCYFCGDRFSKLPRHLEAVHSDKEEIKALGEIEVKKVASKERRLAIRKLANLGNHRNNVEALRSGRGELVVVKRPTEGVAKTFKDYLPCVYCVGWYSKYELSRHATLCKFRVDPKESNDSESMVMQGRALVRDEPKGHPLLSKLLSRLREGEVKDIIGEDQLILDLATYLLRKHETEYHGYIRARLRQIGGFIKFIRNELGEDVKVRDLLNPLEFDSLTVNIKKYITGEFPGRERNSLALKLGHTLKAMAERLRGKCLRDSGNPESQELRRATEDFLELYRSEWPDVVSSQCLKRMYDAKMNKKKDIPLTKDLVKLTGIITKSVADLAEKVKTQPDVSNWRNLGSAILARLICFNKRRGGEMGRMLIKTYKEVLENPEQYKLQQEIYDSLSHMEKALSKSLLLVNIMGTLPYFCGLF